ncbi:MAG: hypothetical protein ACM3NH_00230 [Candidatus Saccharibacteria bacterium]
MRPAGLFSIPSEHKRGFADVDPRYAAGKMPNDGNPQRNPNLQSEGDSMPPAEDDGRIEMATDSEIAALFLSSLTVN